MIRFVKNGRLILPDNSNLQYSGRIDDTDNKNPMFLYPASYVKIKFNGTSLRVLLKNHHKYWNNYIGVIIDGKQSKHKLSNKGHREIHILGEGLEDTVHEVLLFKRMDGCHFFEFYGFVIDKEAQVFQAEQASKRRIEVYGDSVSAGEVAEIEGYDGIEDPVHTGEYSNAWFSYAWFAARELKAELHDIAQGGIALLDHTGYFSAPNQLGMVSVYDKLRFNPELGELTYWNFEKYTPHVVIIAIGQNDSFPIDVMKDNFYGERADHWRNKYKEFVLMIRGRYPKALIILTTTIIEHHDGWDKSIELICNEVNDSKIVHFMYENNGKGTKGHVRIKEAQKMGKELADYIDSFGDGIWRN
ncbi:SGNH/GDSL hydrolase family protein [Anaerosacchariphilus polymeriproducens]|uniref:Electron transporter RnfD n=1 Tax=Anaerosacchariphilus polymeriproducens TaxID=1812858 RepID=A0A371AWV0_9FIRM|nr:electron transporter RnfD [Anaerosacchariphilus polymeriproducens]RDU24064.1 electron transporter RnfD [Anaerosacchariphilus polymeriproducens]